MSMGSLGLSMGRTLDAKSLYPVDGQTLAHGPGQASSEMVWQLFHFQTRPAARFQGNPSPYKAQSSTDSDVPPLGPVEWPVTRKMIHVPDLSRYAGPSSRPSIAIYRENRLGPSYRRLGRHNCRRSFPASKVRATLIISTLSPYAFF